MSISEHEARELHPDLYPPLEKVSLVSPEPKVNVQGFSEFVAQQQKTFWNGEPCKARKVVVIVADAPQFRLYWAREFVGQERNAVEVTYGGQTFYLDDDVHVETRAEALEFLKRYGVEDTPGWPGWGWAKVTKGQGSPQFGHRTVEIERVVGERQ